MDDRETKEHMVPTAQAQKSGGKSSDPGVHAAIGKRLKAYYDDVASEPVPDRFLSLLDALDKAESASKSSGRK